MRKFQHLNVSALRDLDSLTESLRIEGLPHEDLDGPDREFFQLEQGDQLLGYVGVEGSTADRLLRSFFVLPPNRGGGIGAEALKSLETLLRNKGVQSLHLLTTTAAPFFERQGFQYCDRATAPAVIQKTLEFRSLCPANATYMAKRLT